MDEMSFNEGIKVAYFSMEIGVNDELRNYAGGLGVLAGDILMEAADMGVPMVGVSLVYHWEEEGGKVGSKGVKFWEMMEDMGRSVVVRIEDRDVKVRIYKYEIKGEKGVVPILFLSTFDELNKPWDRDLTKELYSSNWYTRLCQEYILGVGGVRAIQEVYGEGKFEASASVKEKEELLGEGVLKDFVFHMNEGHAAFLGLELLREFGGDVEKVREKCLFTTHTPVEAGHDRFDYSLVEKTLKSEDIGVIKKFGGENELSVTLMAMNLSKVVNSVSLKHNEVCRRMFPGKEIANVTNGVYLKRWVGEGVFGDVGLQVVEAKKRMKRLLIEAINGGGSFSRAELFGFDGVSDEDLFSEDVLTIGFARRFVEYKRPDFIFRDLNKLLGLGVGKLQLVFAANCHPDDKFCNGMRGRFFEYIKELRGQIKVVILPKYGLEISKLMVRGCDVWMNNPMPPLEASGTSGMKAAVNYGLNFSILDGWWIEGMQKEPMAGWGIGGEGVGGDEELAQFYRGLEDVVDCYYRRREEWGERMRAAGRLGDWFNTKRVIAEYWKLYGLD